MHGQKNIKLKTKVKCIQVLRVHFVETCHKFAPFLVLLSVIEAEGFFLSITSSVA